MTTHNLNFLDISGFFAPGNNGTILWCAYPTSKEMKSEPEWFRSYSPTNENLYGADYGFYDFIVGDHGLILQDNGPADWFTIDSPTSERLNSVILTIDQDEGFIVGANGTILYGGGDPPVWYIYGPSPTNNDLYSVCGKKGWEPEPNTTWAVGASGTILDYQDGVWSLYPSSPTTEDLFSVFISYEPDYPYAWVCGANGTLLRWDGSSWSKINNIPTTENLYCIWGFGEEDDPYTWHALFCVGAEGTILVSDDFGLTWYTEGCPVTVDLHGVGGFEGYVWAVGDNGTILSHGGWYGAIQPTSLGRVKALYYGSSSVSQKQPTNQKQPMSQKLPRSR